MEKSDIIQIGNDISLAQKATNQLKELIVGGNLGPGSRLPNEPDLAYQLNISRSTLRSALINLERAGFIIRKRGVGTFVANIIPSVFNLNLNSGITQMIRSSGAEPGTLEVLVTIRSASSHVANQLGIDEGSPVVFVERVRTANERRVVFSVDCIPQYLLKTPEGILSVQEIEHFFKVEQSMYDFLSERFSIKVHHAIAWIIPTNADNILAEKLQVPRSSSILLLEQVDYDHEDIAFAFSQEYYVANAFTFTVYRSL